MLTNSIAKYYDEIAKFTKDEQVLKQELALITSILKPGSSILDIACGTGRHLLPLTALQFKLTGIDIAAEHVKQIKEHQKTRSEFDLIKGDFLSTNFQGKKYDGIIVFWNSINEICLSKTSLKLFLKKAAHLIKDQGVIIINIDDIKLLDLFNLNFKNSYELSNGNNFEYSFEQLAYDPIKRITKTQETVAIYSQGKLLERAGGLLIQRWWSKDEIIEYSKELKLTTQVKHIPANSELYLVIRK